MSQQTGSSSTLLLEFGDRVRRSWWTVIAGVCLGLAGGNIALKYLPKVYEATARIWISEQAISDNVVKSTVKDDMTLKLAAFRDEFLADGYMIPLIEQTFGLPEDDIELTQQITQVRMNINIQTLESRRRGVQAFALAYQDTDPQRAANVVNTLTQIYVSKNSDFRKQSATEVADAIQTMAAKAKDEFDAIDAKLTRFKRAHQFETAQHLSANLRLLESRKTDLVALNARRDQLRRDLRLAQDELVQAQNQAAAAGVTGAATVVIDPLTQRIVQAKNDLEALRVRYTEGHPEVSAKRRELEDLLAQARERSETGVAGDDVSQLSSNPAVAAIQQRIQDDQAQLVKLDSDERLLHREIAEYERRIQAEPEVQRQLTNLEEEHAVVQGKWRKLEREAEGAEGSVDLEESNMASGMEVLTEAGLPTVPIKPDPRFVYLAFLFAGIALFVGPMLARHALNPPITSEAGLRTLTAVPVLVTIPRILLPSNRGLSRRNLIKNVALATLAGAVMLSVKFYL